MSRREALRRINRMKRLSSQEIAASIALSLEERRKSLYQLKPNTRQGRKELRRLNEIAKMVGV